MQCHITLDGWFLAFPIPVNFRCHCCPGQYLSMHYSAILLQGMFSIMDGLITF